METGQVAAFKQPAPSGQDPGPVKQVQVDSREVATPRAPSLGDSDDPWNLFPSGLASTASKVIVKCSDFFGLDGDPSGLDLEEHGGRPAGPPSPSSGFAGR